MSTRASRNALHRRRCRSTRSAQNPFDSANFRSRSLTDRIALEADLILTAEVANVIAISTHARGLFERTFTLPEFVAPRVGRRSTQQYSVQAWIAMVGVGRSANEYLRADVPEIADPTGFSIEAMTACAADIELSCRRFAELWS